MKGGVGLGSEFSEHLVGPSKVFGISALTIFLFLKSNFFFFLKKIWIVKGVSLMMCRPDTAPLNKVSGYHHGTFFPQKLLGCEL